MKKYTLEEEKIIKREINKSPGNLSAAFLAASTKINRTKEAIAVKYYTSYNNPESPQYWGTNIIVMSEHKAVKGKVNNHTYNFKKNWFKKLISIFK